MVLLAASLFVVLPIVQPLSSFQRLGTTATEVTEGDLNGRTGQWEQGLRAFMEHPVLGVGTDMYRTVNTLNKVAHNSYLSVLVEEGLIGFTIFLSILGIVALQVLRLPKWDRNFWLTSLLVWAIGASTLTWEHRKTTWFFLTFAVAAAVIGARRSAAPNDVIDLTAHDVVEVGLAMTLPTFLGIGVPRAGTTWLHQLLSAHPDVFLPSRRKEVRFFDRHHEEGQGWYEGFFCPPDEADRYSAIGEISPQYLYCDACRNGSPPCFRRRSSS